MSRPFRSGTGRTALALLALLLPAAALTSLAAPAYASSQVCNTPELAALLGQDCTAPTARIYSAKADPQGGLRLEPGDETTSGFVEFYMSTQEADPDGDRVTFSCRLERNGTVVKDWTDCTEDDPSDIYDYARGNVEYDGLVPGSYTFSAKAEDAAVDKLLLGSAAHNEQADPGSQFAWQVVEPTNDKTPPNTRITTAAKRWHLFPFLAVEYVGDEPLKSAACRFQGQARKCDSSQATIMGLSGGDWTFTVAGIDYAGNVDPTPAVNRFTVPVSSTKLRASGGWSKGGGTGYFMSAYSSTKKKGATLSAARSGTRAVALVVTKCPGCGTVTVSYGNKVLKKVSLAAGSRRKRQLVPIVSWAAGHGGRVTVKVVSSGKPVIVEGLGFSKRG